MNRYLSAAVIQTAAMIIFPGAGRAADGRPATVEDLAGIRDIGGHARGAISVSPDGDYVAFQLQTPDLDRNDYHLEWRVARTGPDRQDWRAGDGGAVILNPGKAPAANGNRPEAQAQWSPDGAWFYYMKKDADGVDIWRSRRDGKSSERLTRRQADTLSFRLASGGGTVLFTTAITEDRLAADLNAEAGRGFLYDDRFRAHLSSTPIARRCGVNQEGRVFSVGYDRDCAPPVWSLDIATGAVTRASPEATAGYDTEAASLSSPPNGDGIWLENPDPSRFTGFAPLLRLKARLGGKDFACPAEACSGYKGVIESAWLDPGGDVVFQRASGTNESMTGLYRWTPGEIRVRTILETEDLLSDCALLPGRVICLRETWTHPRTIASVDLVNGSIKTLYDPNPGFGAMRHPLIEKLEWRDRFGNPTHGHLIYPSGYRQDRRYPLVISTYRSRGFLRGGVGDEYPLLPLAAAGFMVLSHDMPRPYRRYAADPYSGRAQFESNYERRSSLSAQTAIVKSLDRRGLIDPDRVAITGLSDGASQVMFALAHSDRFAVAIASSVFDYAAAYYAKSAEARAFWRGVLGGAPHEDRNGVYAAMSAGRNARRIAAPFLINVSDQELQDSVESFARLEDAGAAVEMYVYPGEHHVKWRPWGRLAIYRRNIQWLKFWLMNEEAADPVDPGQYVRWRTMKLRLCNNKELWRAKSSNCETASDTTIVNKYRIDD